MKSLRNTLLFCCVFAAIVVGLMLLAGGCSDYGAGIATGSLVTHTLEGIEKDLNEKQAAMIVERQVALDKFQAATSDTEKLALEAQVDALTKKIESMAQTQTGVELGQQALETDWKDSQSVANWASSAVLALIGFWAGRKKKAS